MMAYIDSLRAFRLGKEGNCGVVVRHGLVASGGRFATRLTPSTIYTGPDGRVLANLSQYEWTSLRVSFLSYRRP
jgi:hypothetical protein